uniref:Ig-like domain-containing protein n=1 Tax=Cyprinus carpio TaxID=7962 RepID=A0A8C1S0V4_CYPCA
MHDYCKYKSLSVKHYGRIHSYTLSSGQDRVKQSSGEMPESEGAQVILMCNYTTTSLSPDLFWYKQLPNRSPTFILNQYTTEPDFKYSATLNSTLRTFPLMIKNLLVSDSAVYYCALRPTVTETHSALTQKLSNTHYRGLTLRGTLENPFLNSTNYSPN